MGCRYFQWLLGDSDAISDELAPLAEQLCVLEEQESSCAVTSMDWTHKADGLLCADSSGTVTMFSVVTAGMPSLSSISHLIVHEKFQILHSSLLMPQQT